jgi:hypothetical protein
MKNKLLLILAAFAITGGCAGTPHITPTKTEYKVVIPEAKYFTCDEVALPDPKALTDSQVALLINDLVKANKICHNNSVAIHDYLNAAKKELESRKD